MKTSSGISKFTVINNKLASMADEELMGINDRYSAKIKKLGKMKDGNQGVKNDLNYEKELTEADYAIRNAVY